MTGIEDRALTPRSSTNDGSSPGRRITRLRAAWTGGVLGSRDFRLLSVGQLASTIGDYCYAVALPWFILSTTHDTVLLGTILACWGIPRAVLIPLGGSLSDRLSPRLVMLSADLVRCVLVAAFMFFALRGTHSLLLLGPIAALLGAGEGVFLPASAAIMPTILPMERLAVGNSISTAMIQAGSLAGPVLGGLLVTIAGGPPVAFGADAASFAISAAALTLMTARTAPARAAAASRPAQAPDTSRTADAAQAPDTSQVPDTSQPASPGMPGTAGHPASVWALLRRERLLQVLIAVTVAANLVFGGTFEIALPALAKTLYGAFGFGTLIACIGGGMLVGTLTAGRAGSLRRPAIAACAAFLAGGAAAMTVPYLGGLPGACIAIALLGLGVGFGNLVMITLLQQWAPPELLGRVMSVIMLASIGTFPVSVAVSGFLVKTIGPAPFFPVAGAVLALAVLAALTQPVVRAFGYLGGGQPTPEEEPA